MRSPQDARDEVPLGGAARLFARADELFGELLGHLLDEDRGVVLRERGDGLDEVRDLDDLLAAVRQRVEDGLGDPEQVEPHHRLAAAREAVDDPLEERGLHRKLGGHRC